MNRSDCCSPTGRFALRPQRIQEEIVDQGKDISETCAGPELDRELRDQIKKQRDEMCVLEQDMEQAMKDKDKEAKETLAKGKDNIDKSRTPSGGWDPTTRG